MLANPAFPTSRLLARQTLLDYLQACAWVIVDERGIDLTFGGESTATMIDEHSNLIVIRSLTDTFSLPGMPLSCALAHPAVASRISQIAKRPASAALSARLLKLATPDHHLERAREVLETEIPWMQCMLSLVPGISIYPAEANYVMCSFAPGRSMHLGAADAPDLVRKLHKRGFPVRTLDRTPGVCARKPFLRERAHKVGQRAIHHRFAADRRRKLTRPTKTAPSSHRDAETSYAMAAPQILRVAETTRLLDALHLVAGFDNGVHEHGIVHRIGKLRNGGAGIKVDDGLRHALYVLERLLHMGDALRAHHALDGELLFHDDLLIRGRTRIDCLDILLGCGCIRSFFLNVALRCGDLLRSIRAEPGLPRTQTQRIRHHAHA